MDPKEYSDLQKSLFVPKYFNRTTVANTFSENKTIWYCYESNAPKYNKTYGISLSVKKNTWEEMILKNDIMFYDKPFIVGKYINLLEGEYQIRIIVDNLIVNTTTFTG